MKRYKIMKSLLLSVLILTVLCGCTKNVGTTQDNASANLPEEEVEEVNGYKIGFSVIDMENPYFITLEKATREYLEEQNCTMITKDPGTDAVLQNKQIKEMIEEGNCPMDEDTRKLAHKAFGMYLEDTAEDFINFINADHWQNRMSLFTGIYTVCLLEHYEDRNGWIKFLAKVAEAYEKERRTDVYERIVNYLSLFVFDFPSIELSRNLASIVEANIKKMSA